MDNWTDCGTQVYGRVTVTVYRPTLTHEERKAREEQVRAALKHLGRKQQKREAANA